MILLIPCPREVEAFVATTNTWLPAHSTSVPTSNAAMCWYFRRRFFRKKMEVTGPISVELYASSSAVDTDFTAKLIDVRPDGYAQNLTDGILRARYRNSQEKPELLEPGHIYKFTIDLWATSNVFLAGHRLRLEVSSSNF